jgi:hypothetical protein
MLRLVFPLLLLTGPEVEYERLLDRFEIFLSFLIDVRLI